MRGLPCEAGIPAWVVAKVGRDGKGREDRDRVFAEDTGGGSVPLRMVDYSMEGSVMHVNILIPTRNRWDLLRKTVRALERGTYKDFSIYLAVDAKHGVVPPWVAEHGIKLSVDKGRGSLVKQMGVAIGKLTGDAVLGLGDDSILYPDCLEKAVKAMQAHFPVGMGVIGIQQYIDGKPLGQQGVYVLLNRDFISHFPRNNPYCPDYYHYHADIELWKFAQRADCCYFCANAKINHIRVKDATTERCRKNIPKDAVVQQKRTAKGYLWGNDFRLVRNVK